MLERVSSYRLEEEIARGGMGIVYRAVHTVFDEVVAIKAIYPELTLNLELRQRFLNEAKIQRRLQHPNIVQIREFLIDLGNLHIVMEFIEGETLAEHLQQLGRPLLASEAIPIFRQALEGVGFAHSQGVIHRDIKPSNIMLTRQGVAKLTDFGIARAVDTGKLTSTGTALGTPAYMSPEQIQGTELDHRTDIYSLGITLYEMLTGRVPFERPRNADNNFPVLEAHVHQAPTPPRQLVPEIPLFLETAILKALEKRPENRFASCQGFQAALVPSPLPPTKVAVVPELEAERAEAARLAEKKGRKAPFVGEKELRGGTKQERVAPEKGKRARKEESRRAVVASLLALPIVILLALAWVYWPWPRWKVRENPKDGLGYVWIPPGGFMMGCSPRDNECSDPEKPPHEVKITKGLWVGQTEVTVGAYKRFAAATGRQLPPAPNFNSGWADEDMPILNVTWDDASDYCAWAGGRLLTEAEWEYAARGGRREARYGNIDEIAWYDKNSGGQTHKVAEKRANGFGLVDVLGNVWEWVNDWYDDKYYQNSPSSDPPGPTNAQYRVLRGGSWSDLPEGVRVSFRYRYYPYGRSDTLGIRCGREAANP